MESLHDELIVEIFKHLVPFHLSQLRLTCKKFNEIIMNTSKIADKFRLIIDSDGEDRNFMPTWNYRNVRIVTLNEKDLKILNQIGENVKNIIFGFDNEDNIQTDLDLMNIKKALHLCPNVNHLLFDDFTLTNSNGHEADELLLKVDFDYLWFYECSEPILKILLGCSTNKLFLNKIPSESLGILKGFIIKQKQLNFLRFGEFTNTHDLFQDETLVEAEFKLDGMALDLRRFKSHDGVDNIKKFLKNQTNLRELLIHGTNKDTVEIMDTIGELQFMKKMSLTGNLKFDFKPMAHIETLYLVIDENCKVPQNFAVKFPKVVMLFIKFGMNIQIVNNVSSIHALFGHRRINYLQLPATVKNLIFDCSTLVHCHGWENVKIDKLEIYNCLTRLDWLIDLFVNGILNLKSFRLLSNKIKKSQQQLLESLNSEECRVKVTMPMKIDEINRTGAVFEYRNED